MRIGIEAQRLFRPTKFGVEIVALELIRELQKIDTENDYFIFVKADSDNRCLASTENFTIVEVPSSPYPVWEQIVLPRLVKKYNLDLLHCTANTAPVFSSVPVLLTLHDVIFREKLPIKGSSYQVFGNLYRRYLLPLITGKNRILITVSAFEKQKIVDSLKIPANRVVVVHNAVSKAFHPVTDDILTDNFRKKYQLPPRFFLYFGNTAPKKNMRRLLEAYAKYRQKAGTAAWPMVMTDKTGGEYTRQLLRDLGFPELYSALHILHHIPYTDLPVMYSLATVFVYPSLRESFGLPLLEAMACGTPVVASNNSSLPEIGGTAYDAFDPENTEDMSDAMLRMSQSESARLAFREKGLSRAALFSWQHTAAAVKQVYEKFNPKN